STKSFEASRNLMLGRVTRNAIVAQILGVICTLTWALVIDRSIWALVAGNLCAMIATTVLSHVALPGVPNRWDWDRSAFQEILGFGKWMFVSSLLGFLAINGDRLLLGGLINSNLLGVYTIAFLIFSSVEQMMSKIVMGVLFPAFSEVARERRSTLKRSYYRFHLATSSFTYACAGALMMSGDTIVRILYDQRYAQAGWMFQVLAVAIG